MEEWQYGLAFWLSTISKSVIGQDKKSSTKVEKALRMGLKSDLESVAE